MKSEPTSTPLAELRDGYERNFNEERDTAFSFSAPLLRKALALMTDEQIKALKQSKAWREITKKGGKP
jgi:hypothetical protein